ncbi:MAG TPA: CHASE3 domain-containing protein [Kofleriaceae bacterium]|nr:CHASE3 domain-containing protein [Kofleriaceae bacterium]
MNTWTFGRKIAAGFALSSIVLVVVAVVGYRTTAGLVENQGLVAHTHEVRAAIAELSANVIDVQNEQRGYVITGQESYLDPYRAALPRLEATYSRLRALTADNPEQQRRLDGVRRVIDARLAQLAETIELRKAGLEAAVTRVTTGEGERTTDELRAALADMDSAEVGLLQRRTADAESSARAAKIMLAGGAAIGLVLVVLIGWLITRSLSSQIGTVVRHVQSSSTELHAAASQQASSAKEQATAMSEMTTTINELLATSRQISESAQRVAQIADQTAGTARAGNGTVDKAQEAIAAIRRQVDLVVGHMVELGKGSQKIGAVLDIVAELAEQTNILAINATIEAAGAGEAGRRFAVVADEIRKLADRVAASAKEIRGLIEEVRSAVNTTVMVTETGSKAVDAGGRHFGEVAASFKQIAGQVITTTDAAREIELSTKQQSTAVEQVHLAIANIGQVSRETEASSTQTLQTSSQLAGLSRDLLRMVQPGQAA